jgi:hypothetical protein
MSNTNDIAADTLEGAAAIAVFIGKTERQANHLLSKKQLPAYKLGNIWHMRKSTYEVFIECLESKAAASCRKVVSISTTASTEAGAGPLTFFG